MKANNEIQQSRIGLLNKEKEIQQVQLEREVLQKKILFISILILSLAGFIVFRSIILRRHDERLKLGNQIKIEQLEGAKAKAELQQQANELEMHALRAQMNPHFIFNSLSAINMLYLRITSLKHQNIFPNFQN